MFSHRDSKMNYLEKLPADKHYEQQFYQWTNDKSQMNHYCNKSNNTFIATYSFKSIYIILYERNLKLLRFRLCIYYAISP